MNVEPAFTLSVGGQDRTSVLAERLKKINVRQTTGKEADRIELTFDDRDNVIDVPAHGVVLQLAIGYVGQPLVDQGSFTVDEDELAWSPDVVVVRAKSADMRASLKSHKSRAWRATTVGAIVAQVAAENGLNAQVHPDLAGVDIDHRDQANESDLHFLTRLGKDHDAITSAKGGKLIFAPRGQAVSSSGQSLAPLVLRKSDVGPGRMKNSDRHKHGSVRGRHRGRGDSVDSYEEAGSGGPTKTLRHIHGSAGHASAAAHAEHRRLKRLAHGVTFEMPGEPSAFAGRPVQLVEFREGINGAWVASETEHDIDFESSGFITHLTATVDGLDADSDDGDAGYGGDDADSPGADGGSE